MEIHVGIRRTLNPYLWERVGREMCSVVKEYAEAFRSFIFVDVESALVTLLYDDRSRWGSNRPFWADLEDGCYRYKCKKAIVDR